MANRRSYKLTHELLSTRVVMMEGNALRNYRAQLLHNFNSHIPVDELLDQLPPTECHHMVTYKKGTHEITGLQFFDENLNLVETSCDGDCETVAARPADEDEERVLILEMTGPVTRYGGMCSYGSIDYRDLLTQYATDDSVVGFVLVTDTPGGTAFALHDFAQGMEAWNAAGKRSIQYIDGMSCSAGVALGSQCQKVIAQHGKDTVGCIGAMMAGWATADGTVDSDGNRYIDITATQTPDKNGEFRAAAAGDYEGLQAEVDACCNDFFETLDRCRPQIPAEQRTGHTYEAESVIGTLIDGIGTYEMACHYALTGEVLWQESNESNIPNGTSEPNASSPIDAPDLNPDEDPDYDPDEDPNNANQTQEDMTQIQAERLAARTGLSAEEILAIANTEEDLTIGAPQAQAQEPASPAEPAATVLEGSPEGEQPEAEPEANGSEPAAPAEPAAQTEEPEAPAAAAEPAAQAEEPEAPATPAEPEAQVEEPEAPAAPAEPAATVPSGSPEGDPEHPATPSAIAALQAQFAEMQKQFAALQQQHTETVNSLTATQQQLTESQASLSATQQQLATSQSALANAQAEAAALRTAAPSPAMPAAPAHAATASTPATRINGNMTPAEKLAAYKAREAQLRKSR